MNEVLTTEEVVKFYQAVADLMVQHNVTAIAGIWIGPGEQHGLLRLWDVGDTKMKAMVFAIADKWEGYLRECRLNPGCRHQHREIRGSDSQKN